VNRREVYDILTSIDAVLSGDYAPQEKVDAVKAVVDSFTGAWIESTTYEVVRALAKQKVSTGKMMQVKTLVKLCGVDRLEELRDDATKMAALHDFLKIL
jgi:phage I-like protein